MSRNNFLIVTAIFLSHCNFSCSSDKSTENEIEILEKVFPSQFTNRTSKFLAVIIPLGTCSGCVNYLLDYAQQNMNKPDYKFILVYQGFDDKLVANYFTEKELDLANNITLDKNGISIEKGFGDAYYPMFYYIKDGKIVKSIKLESRNIKYEIENAELYLDE